MKTLIKALSICFVLALLSTLMFTGVSFKNMPVASATYRGDTLTGCGTQTVTMKQNVNNGFGQRILTVKMGREFDWCRDLRCQYFRLVPCYWGTAPINSTALARPSVSLTNLALGWELVVDKVWSTWKNHVEGGDWGYHSELDTYAQFHLKQCFGVGPVSLCGTRRSYSWKLAVDGSGAAHLNYKWGG